MCDEVPVFFDCVGDRLLGILHRPKDDGIRTGVLLVVGGPQYRVGSHRQFVLLARDLAAAGIPVFRFDCRGMGDSTGAARDFEGIAQDIGAALDAFCEKMPDIGRFVLWGLCDAAAANAFYACADDRVVGQIALNPWVRTDEGEAQTFIKHYYLQRLLSGAFWRKVLSLRFDVAGAARDFLRKLAQSRGTGGQSNIRDSRPLPVRLREAQIAFPGPTLLILSGRDLTSSVEWQAWMASAPVTVQRLAEADHTFSSAAWRDRVAVWSRDWVLGLAGRDRG